MITNKEFEKRYGAELLPASVENYAVGDLWDWERISKPFGAWILQYQQVNIAQILGLPEIKTKLEQLPLLDANLPDIDATSATKVDAGIEIPSINLKIGNKLSVDSVTKISFGDVKAKNMRDCRFEISEKLEELKETDFSKYKKYIRLKEIGVQLYYSDSVLIEVDRKIKDEAEIVAEINSIGLKFTVGAEVNKKVTIKIASKKCPFAVQIVKGKEFE